MTLIFTGVINMKSFMFFCRHAELTRLPFSRHPETLRLARRVPSVLGSSYQVSASNQQGFTLIELLVVVLIIGILAAVALPRYELAVSKSRVAQVLPFMASVQAAQEAYYMANGFYSDDWSELDVSIPPGAAVSVCNSGARNTQCAVLASGVSCPLRSSGGVLYCRGDRIPQIGFTYEYGEYRGRLGRRVCYASETSDRQNKVCKALGGVLKATEFGTNRYAF